MLVAGSPVLVFWNKCQSSQLPCSWMFGDIREHFRHRGKSISSFFTWEKGRSMENPLNKKRWISPILKYCISIWPYPPALLLWPDRSSPLPELCCTFPGVLSLCYRVFVHLLLLGNKLFPEPPGEGTPRATAAWRRWVMTRSKGAGGPCWGRCSRRYWERVH